MRIPPIVVISLVESEQRRSYMRKQLTARALPFRFFDAERLLSYPKNYNRVARLRNYANDLTLGECGGYDSHCQVWAEFIASGEDVLCILEDDVDVLESFKDGVRFAMASSFPWGICRLGGDNGGGRRVVGSCGSGQVLVDYRKQPKGTYGYLIRRQAASVLLEFARSMEHPVDDMINRYWEHGRNI